MFWELAALFRFSFQLAIPEVKSENDASPTPQKKKKNLSGGPLSLKIGNELFKLRKQEFPAKVHQSVGLAQAHPFEQKNRVIKI